MRPLRLCAALGVLLLLGDAAGAQALAGSAAPIDCTSPIPSNLAVTPIDQSDSWSPVGGDVDFTIHAASAPNARPVVCFRWLTNNGSSAGGFVPSNYIRNLVPEEAGVREFIATVPKLGAPVAGGVRSALGTVPLAEVRVLLVDSSSNKIVAYDNTRVGITDAAVALALTGLATLAAFAMLVIVAPKRGGTKNWFLRILATPDGHASISHFQLLLWTFVIAASALYVVLLSGELVEIKPHLLVLLGISGAANLGARITGAPAAPAQPGPASWADLVMNGGQVDPTRVQMLFFTLITAVFVLVYVVSVYQLPEIPDGFMVLMGVSNTLYVGAKVVNPGSQPGARSAPPANDAAPTS